jgi:hypothetical protein
LKSGGRPVIIFGGRAAPGRIGVDARPFAPVGENACTPAVRQRSAAHFTGEAPMIRPTPIALLLLLAPGLAFAGGMSAGATTPRPPVAAVPPPMHSAGHGHAGLHPAVPPVFFNPFVPAFVTFAPPVVIVAPPPMHSAGHGHAGLHPAVPPVFFNPFVPAFVTFAPPVVIVAPAPIPVHQPAGIGAPPVAEVPIAAPVPPGIPVAPPLPSSGFFFAPPVRVATPPPADGQVLIIRRHTH